jgi:hypothetical protein
LLCFLYVSSASTVLGATLRTIALKGQHAPGTADGVNFESFVAPLLNASGKTAFRAGLTGPGVQSNFNNVGFWSDGLGPLSLVARTGQQPVGTATGVEFNYLTGFLDESGPWLAPTGQTAFSASLRNVAIEASEGIWYQGTTAAKLERDRDSAPGITGVSFREAQAFAFNSGGRFALSATLFGGGFAAYDTGLWSGTPGNLKLIARTGTVAPGISLPTEFDSLGLGGINSQGQVVFPAATRRVGTIGSDHYSVWLQTAGTLRLVANSGDPAPGTADNLKFNGFSQPTLNSAGQTAFFASMSVSGAPGYGANESLWVDTLGALRIVVREGQHAPGMPDGVAFGWASSAPSFSELALNARGDTVFKATLQGPGITSDNVKGIWAERNGSLDLIACIGCQVPDMPAGVTFASLDIPSINANGQVAFQASITGGPPFFSSGGIWAEDRAGKLRPIALNRGQLEVAPGVFHQISSVDFISGSGNSDGRPSGFNDLGQLAFSASFFDGTYGAFVSDIATVPEPTPTTLIMISIITLSPAATLRRSGQWRRHAPGR